MMLYAARVAWGDARGAAAAALIRARTRERDAMRAAKEADAATGSKRELAATRVLTARLEAHCGALLVVVNALRLCAPGERSVALSDEDGEGFDDDKKETDAAGGKAAKRRRVPGRGRATLADLLREYALAATRLELLVAGADVASLGFAEESALPTATAADGGEASSDDARAAVVPGLVAACCAHGLFTAATTLATHWTEGEALTNLATVIAATLAARAALAQIAAGGSGARQASSFDPSSLEPGGGAGGYGGALASAGGLLGGDLGEVAGRDSDRGDSPDPAACWSALRSFLETHDSPARGHRLTEAAGGARAAAAPASAAAVAPGAVHVGPGRERRGGDGAARREPRGASVGVPAPRSAGGGGAARARGARGGDARGGARDARARQALRGVVPGTGAARDEGKAQGRRGARAPRGRARAGARGVQEASGRRRRRPRRERVNVNDRKRGDGAERSE